MLCYSKHISVLTGTSNTCVMLSQCGASVDFPAAEQDSATCGA